MTRWVAMVQREVGERLAAPPGDAALRRAVGARAARRARCGCCGRSRAACSTRCRTSTRCSSGCAGAGDGGEPAASPELRGLVRGAFAHRRKTLVGSLALADAARRGPALVRASGPRGARRARPAGGRARRAPLAGGLPRARGGARAVSVACALPTAAGRWRRAKVNLGLFVGPTREPTAATSSSR